MANKKCTYYYYNHLVATSQGPGLPVMPVMGTHRGDRVHLSEQIDLMAEVTAIGFVVPALDPHNAGAKLGRRRG
jgi:hypothetical protein